MELEEVKTYLGMEYDYDDKYISELIEVSEIYIQSCAGERYLKDEKALKLAKLVQKKIINDMWENRGTEIPTGTKKDTIVTTILEKLSMVGDEYEV